MAEPLYPKGYVKLRDVYSGQLEGKPRGVIDSNNKAIAAFFYKHFLNRSIPISGELFATQGQDGFWTVQVRASNQPGSKILFEQSVDAKAIGVEEAGGLLTVWFIPPLYQIRFKTRICDGQYVLPVVEEYETTPNPAPDGTVGLPIIFNVKVTSMTVKLPALPEGADSFTLLYAKDRYGAWSIYKTGLAADEESHIDVVADLGITSSNPNDAATELVWFKLRTAGPGGVREGDSIRDTWTVSRPDGTGLLAGYQGWLHADTPHPTSFYEQAYSINESASTGNFGIRVEGDWISPAYKCNLPKNAYLDIISDYWVGEISNNDIYYAISFRPKAGEPMAALRDPITGEHWVLVLRGNNLVCTRTLRRELFVLSEQDPVVLDQPSTWTNLMRAGANLYSVVSADAVYLVLSQDDGLTWSQVMVPIRDVEAFAAVQMPEGGFLVLGKATATEVDNSKPADELIDQNDLLSILVQLNADGTSTTTKRKITSAIFPTENVFPLTVTGGTYKLLVRADDLVHWFESTDGVDWQEILPAP